VDDHQLGVHHRVISRTFSLSTDQRHDRERDLEAGRQAISCKTGRLRLELDPLPVLVRVSDRRAPVTDHRNAPALADQAAPILAGRDSGRRESATGLLSCRKPDDPGRGHQDKDLRECGRQVMDLAIGRPATDHRDTGHRDTDLQVTDLQVTVPLAPAICRIMVVVTGDVIQIGAGDCTTTPTTGGAGQPPVP
jgi:hypothetical protein